IEAGMEPREATIKAMDTVSGPVVAVGLVLSAVFVPCAFISGIVGLFFRQFAITIAVSTVISAFNSLTLSPALSALLLRPRHEGEQQSYLSWPAFVVVGGALGFRFLSLNPTVARYVSWTEGLAIGMAAGLFVGLALNGPIN